MRAALLVLLLAAPAVAVPAPAVSAPTTPDPRFRLHLGVQIGFVHFVGAHATATFYSRGRPRFDVDLLWEPSAYLQSYSAGFAYHILDRMFFVGTRLRLLQLHFPGTRGYDAGADNHLGVGLEAGLRAPVGPAALKRRLLVTFTVGTTAVATASPAVQWLLNLNLGVAWAVLTR